MKKVLSAMLALLLILSMLSGCHKTPESPIVIGKNNQTMIDMAIDEDGGALPQDIREEYGIPYEFNISKEYSDVLSVNASAQIQIPDCDGLPLLRAAPADFSQELVSSLFHALCEGCDMHDVTLRSKNELEEEILMIKQVLENPEYAEDEDIQEMYADLLAVTEMEYKNAPEGTASPLSDGTLKLITRYDPSARTQMYSYYGLYAADQTRSVTFSVENNNSLTKTYVTKQEGDDIQGGIPVKRNASVSFMKQEAQENYSTYPMSRIYEYDAVPDIAQGKLSITPSEALQHISSLLNGTDMVISGLYLTSGQQEKVADNNISYAYRIFCTREIEGVPCAYLRGMFSSFGNDSYAPSWYYEGIDILLSDDGIFSFKWNSPHEITETISERCNLLGFSEVSDIFDKMIYVSYFDTAANLGDQRIRIDVSEVKLELNRVIEQNAIETGLMVPTWNFYGKMVLVDSKGSETIRPGFYSDGRAEILLSINAIDGSIIDLSKGY